MKHLIFSDFDGTLTEKGKLTAHFQEIIDLVKSHDGELVIVSGRSHSWGLFLITHFAMDAAVMEGGGVIVRKRANRTLETEILATPQEVQQLQGLASKISLTTKCPLSADSQGRITDRAIELRDLENNMSCRDQTLELIRSEGANLIASDIHINFWYGNLSKYLGVKRYLETTGKDVPLSNCLFFGDALNDESMFEHFPHTVGVSNIQHVLPKLKHPPKTILQGPENQGPRGVLNHLKTYFERRG